MPRLTSPATRPNLPRAVSRAGWPAVMAALIFAAGSGCGGENPAAGGGADPARAPKATPADGSEVPRSPFLDRRSAPVASPTPAPKPTHISASAAVYGDEDFPAYAATAVTDRVAVYAEPGGTVLRTFAHPTRSGAPLTFLLAARNSGWLRVHLPARPNGSTGWVRAGDVTVRGVPWRVDVHRDAHTLRLYDRDQLVASYPIGVGTADTPTPGGVFYLTELLSPLDPTGPYGPYAYGLSGFSERITSFAGGDGVIGLHGTNDPGTVGRDVSHGCIRLRNADITALARRLPLGTPVRVLA